MNTLSGITKALRARWIAMGRRRQLAAGGLAGLVVVVAIWLASSAGRSEYVAALSGASAEDAARAARLLEQRGIAPRIEAGQVLVLARDAGRARTIIAQELPAENATEPFEAIAKRNDIWSSKSSDARDWQTAKMAYLGKLVQTFSGVRSAAVLFEPGTEGSLGRPGVEATAVVNITMAAGAEVGDELVAAIADQVAGGVPGLSPQNVRIIDSAGRSHHAVALADDAVARLRRAETHFEGKIRAALPHIPNMTAGVHVEFHDDQACCLGAAVLVPRSYLERAARDDGRSVDDELAGIRRTVASVAGLADAQAVHVDAYSDATARPAAAETQTDAADWSQRNAPAMAMVTILAGTVLLLWLRAYRRSRRRLIRGRFRSAMRSRSPAGDDAGLADETSGEPFARFRNMPADELLALVRQEHPQTIALVLTRFSAEKAAAILAGLPGEKQADVMSRVAALEGVDEGVLREIEQAMAQRLDRTPDRPARVGGLSAAADILQHAGYATEQAVLARLSTDEPGLVEAIRKRIFALDDLASAPAEWLHPALMRMDSSELALALRTAGQEVRRKVFACLPSSARKEVKAAMDRMGPVRLSDVEAAQQRLIEQVRSGKPCLPADSYVSEAGRRAVETESVL